jgi:hypothetical protein
MVRLRNDQVAGTVFALVRILQTPSTNPQRTARLAPVANDRQVI